MEKRTDRYPGRLKKKRRTSRNKKFIEVRRCTVKYKDSEISRETKNISKLKSEIPYRYFLYSNHMPFHQ